MSMIGKALGSFECTALLGKGGMGEVYKAKDQKLGRDVAIKVLPEEFAKDADRVARFKREAKLLASLNHPNIAGIYGLEESDGTHFLVLELIEGDTLADRLKRGAIPVEESLKLALQIAEALEAAHEKGVIHRDLKPANIKVTPDGKVKVLDFGLAKAFTGDSEDINLSNSPTLSVAATQQGIILGTAAYMSPEQASGETVDKRTDIWAFGVVVFEMLTGRALFVGNNVSQTLASVIKSEPEWQTLPPNLHPRIRFLLERCLEKETKNRYSSIGDARVEIQKVLTDPGGVFGQSTQTTKPQERLRVGIPWVIAAVVAAVIIAAIAVWSLKPTPPAEPRPVTRFYHEVLFDHFLRSGETLDAISADGTRIVYVANDQLYLKKLSELHAIPIQGTDEVPANPFFSPDGQWVGYYSFADGQWKKIPVSGGASVTICDAPAPNGAVWTTDNTILFGQNDGSCIKRVSDKGGNAVVVIEAGQGEGVYGPQVLPGGEWVLFTLTTTTNTGPSPWDKAQIALKSLNTGERKVLPVVGSDARYVPTGHIVYAQGNVLYAVAFDIENMEVVGERVPVVDGIQRGSSNVTGTAHYGFSDTGTLIYVAGDTDSDLQKLSMVWVGVDGEEEPLEEDTKLHTSLKISPDGKKIASSIVEDEQDIQVWHMDRKNWQKTTFGNGSNAWPLWTPNSERIIFSRYLDDESGIYWKAANGTGKAELIGSKKNMQLWPSSLSKDGKTLFLIANDGADKDIYMMSMEGKHEAVPLLNDDRYSETDPMISPDSQWIAYTSYGSDSEIPQVYVRPFPNVEGGKWEISTNGGRFPIWSPHGRELFYRNPGEVIAVEYETEPTFEKVSSKILFRGNYIHQSHNQWDISPDGRRFLMLKSASIGGSDYTINIVVNWFEELNERVSTD